MLAGVSNDVREQFKFGLVFNLDLACSINKWTELKLKIELKFINELNSNQDCALKFDLILSKLDTYIIMCAHAYMIY